MASLASGPRHGKFLSLMRFGDIRGTLCSMTWGGPFKDDVQASPTVPSMARFWHLTSEGVVKIQINSGHLRLLCDRRMGIQNGPNPVIPLHSAATLQLKFGVRTRS